MDASKISANRIKSRFGISQEQYDRILAAQGGVCAICGGSGKSLRFRRLVVDHCHATGRIRGLLCSRCNRGLGYFDDDVARFKSAIVYLKNSFPVINEKELDRTLPPRIYHSDTKNPRTKLTKADLVSIMRLARKGLTHRQIADKFGVDHSTVGRFLRGETRVIARKLLCT